MRKIPYRNFFIGAHHTAEEWRPLKDWPTATFVQWGGGGVVFGEQSSYVTAFFEAFPIDGSAGFIRGEGETIAHAEDQAFAKWFKQSACHAKGHRWSRTRRMKNGKFETHTNGHCFCLNCGASQTVMEPIVHLGAYRVPLSVSELNSISEGFCRPAPWDDGRPDSAKWRKKLKLRAHYNGIELPPETPRDEKHDLFDPDDYEKGCKRSVVKFLRANTTILEGKSSSLGNMMFDSLSILSLTKLMEQYDD